MLIGSRWFPLGINLVLIVGGCALLEIIVDDDWLSAFVIAPPSEVLGSIPRLFDEEHLVGAILRTFGMTFAAAGAAVVTGTPIGWMLFRVPTAGRVYEPWLMAVFASPVLLLYPVFLVFFGRSVLAVVAMGYVVALIPMILKTREGFQGVPPVLLRVASVMGMSPRVTLFKVLLPATLPTLFVGVRLAIVYALINVVAIEFLVGLGGLGALVANMYDRFDIPGMYAAVLFVILVSVLFFAGVERIERALSWS